MRWKWFDLQTGLEVTCCCEKEQKTVTTLSGFSTFKIKIHQQQFYVILSYCIVLYCIVFTFSRFLQGSKQLVTIVYTVNVSTADKVIHINIEIETKLSHLPHIAHLQQECHNSKFGICGLLA